jgi:Beta-lactamase enzyme family
VFSTPADDRVAQVHLGSNFPVTLTSDVETVDDARWRQATWMTPGRHGTGWLPATSLTTKRPAGVASASLDALDQALGAYLTKLGKRVGVKVWDVTRGVAYTWNAGVGYLMASSVKVPIMLALLTRLEAKGRRPTTAELTLLTTMIENSNNDSATALWTEIGNGPGLAAFMRKVGIAGYVPSIHWGYSSITPTAMVALLGKLHAGTILSAADRKLALGLMEHVQAGQRSGVGDSSPAGATIAMKDGWVPGPDGQWEVNSSGIVTVGSETYIISVYTTDSATSGAGFAITRHVCEIVGDRLVP